MVTSTDIPFAVTAEMRNALKTLVEGRGHAYGGFCAYGVAVGKIE